ncbi:unnamed protein product [Ostreobium quekettii]|uniref:RNase III domain-containing protein n=1 Tax=Ostreobium quekettii TaxID=121088 RepID=A0A8S1IWJ5_9CHLO|nr:unnamed protein product [Ostreobium quekettii]|eukprot:evm.model.scf_375EXC.1 EVM.evm.TU.scf_375EXC.1   scf_375EXC:3918-10242(-)
MVNGRKFNDGFESKGAQEMVDEAVKTIVVEVAGVDKVFEIVAACPNLSPQSPLDTPYYALASFNPGSLNEYYKVVADISIQNKEQPLLLARPINLCPENLDRALSNSHVISGSYIIPELCRPLPFPAHWLKRSLALQGIMPAVFCGVRVELLRRRLGIPSHIPSWALTQAVQQPSSLSRAAIPDITKRLEYVGDTALKYAYYLHEFVTDLERACTGLQSKFQNITRRQDFIDAAVRNNFLDLLMVKQKDSRQLSTENAWQISSADAPSFLRKSDSNGVGNGAEELDESARSDELESHSSTAEDSLAPLEGNVQDGLKMTEHDLRAVVRYIRAILGICYNYSGTSLVMAMCKKLWMWKFQDEVLGYIQSDGDVNSKNPRYHWEPESMPGPRGGRSTKLHQLSDAIGYQFKRPWRLKTALTHPSCTHSYVARAEKFTLNYKAFEILGAVALDLILAEHLFITAPELSQAEVNKILNPKLKNEIFGRCAAMAQLDMLMMHRVEFLNQEMHASRRELRSFEKQNGHTMLGFEVRKVWTELFRSLAGAVLVDSGFSLEEVRRVVLPPLNRFLPSLISKDAIPEEETNHFYRFIPTAIEAGAFEDPSCPLQRHEFYATAMTMTPAVNAEAPGPEASTAQTAPQGGKLPTCFVILTKRAIPNLAQAELFVPDSSRRMIVAFEPAVVGTVVLTDSQADMAERFQSKFFKSMFIPETYKAHRVRPFEKRYLLLPAVVAKGWPGEAGGEGTGWLLAWDLIQRVMKDEVPDSWNLFLEALCNVNVDVGALKVLARSVLESWGGCELWAEEVVHWDGVEDVEQSGCEALNDPEVCRAFRGLVMQNGKRLIQGRNLEVKGHTVEVSPAVAGTATVSLHTMEPAGSMDMVPGERYMELTGSSMNRMAVNLLRPVSLLAEKASTLPLRNCRLKPYTKGWLDLGQFLPSALHRFEGMLLAEDFRTQFDISPKVPTTALMGALTSKHACEPFDYDRLEYLGASVLKYMASHMLFKKGISVGEMSTIRFDIITRGAVLADECIHDVAGHIMNAKFLPATKRPLWHPPGVEPYILLGPGANEPTASSSGEDMPVGSAWRRSSRQLVSGQQEVNVGSANAVAKAVAAACFDYDSIEAAGSFFAAARVFPVQDWSAPVPEGRRFEQPKYEALEGVLGYRFNDMQTLGLAFTHSSMHMGADYEGLEFLGDAALELIVTQHLLKEHPSLSLGDIQVIRNRLLSNESWARLALTPPLQLHRLLIHNAGGLSGELEATARRLEAAAGVPPGLLEFSPQKVCSDMFESLAGAVLVDSGFSVEAMRRVFLPLMRGLLAAAVGGKGE